MSTRNIKNWLIILIQTEYNLEFLTNNMTSNQYFPSSVNLVSNLIAKQISPVQSSACPACGNNNDLVCYACCLNFACNNCYNSNHFNLCQKNFNKYVINLNSNQEKQDKKNKNQKIIEKCKRCEEYSDLNQYCIQCRLVLCCNCSMQVHSKGKFNNHRKTVSLHIQNNKMIESKIINRPNNATENQEVDEKKHQKKQNLQNIQYGFKARQKINNSRMSVNNINNKKGRSIAKVPFQKQQNVMNSQTKMQKSVFFEEHLPTIINQSSKQQNHWFTCAKHSKPRTLLTDSFQIICGECYEEIKSSFSRAKLIDRQNLIKSDDSQQKLANLVEVDKEVRLKLGQVSQQYKHLKVTLSNQLLKRQEALEEKYNHNLQQLQKWQNINKDMLNDLCYKIEELQKENSKLISYKCQNKSIKSEIAQIFKIKLNLVFEQITKSKKQLFSTIDQSQIKITQINIESFEEMLRSFNVVKRKTDIEFNQIANSQQKSLSKMNQPNQIMRQSRISNSSMTSDRKQQIPLLRRDESTKRQPYNPHDYSNHIVRRSTSKDYKNQIHKQISSRVLFPHKSIRKTDEVKMEQDKRISYLKKTQNFFESQQPINLSRYSSRKEKLQIADSYNFKQVKYINLQTFVSENQDKISPNGQKKQNSQVRASISFETESQQAIVPSTSRLINKQQELPSNNQNLIQKVPAATSDGRISYSMNIGQALLKKTTIESGQSSVNSSAYTTCQKNKRKSDYMEMRDRLKKPQGAINKTNK